MTNSRSLIDGTVVLSDSPEWLAECEARHILSLGSLARETFYSFATKMRGDAAAVELKERVAKIEPHYVLGLGSRDLRAAYLDRVRSNFGEERAIVLEHAVRELWRAKKRDVSNVE